VKDFYYNLTRSLGGALNKVVETKNLRTDLFDCFYKFIDHEYSLLLLQKKRFLSKTDVIDQMTYANMVDSEDFKKYRRVSYAKLYCYLEMFKQANSLKKIPNVEKF